MNQITKKLKIRNKPLIILGLLLIISAVGIYIGERLVPSSLAGREYHIILKNASLNKGSLDIKLVEKMREKEAYQGIAITYAYRQEIETEVGMKSEKAILVLSNSDYSTLDELHLLRGSFFSKVTYGAKEVVLNEALAFELFGSNDIIGQEIKINNEYYKILGIVKDIKKDEGPCAYINAADWKSEEIYLVNELMIIAYKDQKLLNYGMIEALLAEMGQEKGTYHIHEIKKRDQDLISIYNIVLSSIGVLMGIGCLREVIRLAYREKQHLTQVLKTQYIQEYILMNKVRYLNKIILLSGLGGLGTVFLVRCSEAIVSNIL